jgi:hypothetical protein
MNQLGGSLCKPCVSCLISALGYGRGLGLSGFASGFPLIGVDPLSLGLPPCGSLLLPWLGLPLLSVVV